VGSSEVVIGVFKTDISIGKVNSHGGSLTLVKESVSH
jgi:hypothetical protein